MHPTIGHIGPFTVYSFGLLLALAVVLCSYLLSRDTRAAGISQQVVYDFVFWVILGGIAGARFFFVVLNFSDFVSDPKQIIMISNGGLAWQGGLVFGALAGFLFVRKKKLPLGLMADFSAPYLALGQAIGRIGCFLNGCCYGKEVSWGIYFPVHQNRLHPAQVYDSLMLVLIFFFLKIFQKKSRGSGRVFAAYLMLAATARFINEFFRGDHVNTAVGLSIFQLVSLGVFLIGAGLYARLSPRTKTV